MKHDRRFCPFRNRIRNYLLNNIAPSAKYWSGPNVRMKKQEKKRIQSYRMSNRLNGFDWWGVFSLLEHVYHITCFSLFPVLLDLWQQYTNMYKTYLSITKTYNVSSKCHLLKYISVYRLYGVNRLLYISIIP